MGLNTTGSVRCTHPSSTFNSPRCFCERRIKDENGSPSYYLRTSRKASLIVIPSTLFGNWLQEVVQHVDLDANLNIEICIARTGFNTTPVARRNVVHDTFF